MTVTLKDLSRCVHHAAEGKADAAARALLRRLVDVPADSQVGGIMERLLMFATIDEADVEAFEAMHHAFQIRLSDGTLIWMAAQDCPPLVPPGPRFSLRGMRALAIAVRKLL